MKKICINTREAQKLLNCSDSYVRREFRNMRELYKKPKGKPITIKEFCNYMHLDYNEVRAEIDVDDPE